jgi:Zn-dependent M28 family amino/carboxypeptidase
VEPTRPQALATTLQELAGFGDKHVGTAPGQAAGEYLLARFRKLGLSDAHTESFAFPRHDVVSSALAVNLGGAALSIGFDVLEGSGSGHADADLVYVGTATPMELSGIDVHGKIALVDRALSYHRAAQYRNLSAAGAVAMVYVSAASQNLRQVGSVRYDGWSPLGPIPAISIGQVDGAQLEAAVKAQTPVHAVIDVQAATSRQAGNNVIARIPGADARGQIVLGAHYDTWFTGSCDNGGGIAALLALAARRLLEGQPRYSLVFVAYDGEEVALYGGYDYLRKHRIVGGEPILAAINFEMPSAVDASVLGLARSNHDALDEALRDASLNDFYTLYAPMDAVPQIFGGVIPTDIQGIYRNGVPTASTAVDSPWYHTVGDTPDKVDVDMLAGAVDAFDAALGELLKDDPARFAGLDAKLWRATVSARPRGAADPLTIDVDLADARGGRPMLAPVQATLLVDDFFAAAQLTGTTDTAGHASFTFPAAAATTGAGNRYVHVTAGASFPVVEQIISIQ